VAASRCQTAPGRVCGAGAIGISPATRRNQGLRAIVDDDVAGQIEFIQRGQDQFHVARILFDEEYVSDIFKFGVHS
jgi:hypothetical protein